MRVLRGTTILFIVGLFVLGGPEVRAGEDGTTERELLEKADEHLGQAATALVETLKKRIDAGDFDGVEKLMVLLREIMKIRAELEAPGAPAEQPSRQPRRQPAKLGSLPAAPPPGKEGQHWFGGRGGQRNLRSNGGSAATAEAVDLALSWLARHQDLSGTWKPEQFTKSCTDSTCSGPGQKEYIAGITALALLPFLANGHTHHHGPNRVTVGKGLSQLLEMQDPEGCIGARHSIHFTYGHALGAQALAEAYALSRDPNLMKPAQAAMDFISKAQNPYLAWRYGVRPQDNDTSVTAMMVSALMAGKKAGLRVNQAGFEGALAWIEKATEPEYGRVGYTSRGTGPARPQNMMDKFPADKSESLTAAGMLMRMYCGEDPRKSEIIQKGADLCLKVLPVWDESAGSIDFYYWYFGTQAMFQVGGDAFKYWNKAMKTALIDSQVKNGCAKGSWNPVGVWGRQGGRIYSTALATLCLQTYYRHGRLFTAKWKRQVGK